MMVLPEDLAPELVPLAWLLGTWRGEGVGGYPTIEEFHFGQEVRFGHVPGKTFLTYESRSWGLLDDRPLARETGFWRIQPDNELEVVLSHGSGITEIWIGSVKGAKVELRTDLVARTGSAMEYTAGHRLYGLVDGALLWAFDMAAVGQSLQPHLSAQLRRAA